MKNLLFGAILALLLYPSYLGASVISDAAAGTAAGTWSSQIATGNFLGGNILRPHGTTGLGSSLEYMDKAVWNPINQSVIVLGGAHGSPPVGGTDGTVFAIYTSGNDTWRSSCDDNHVPECISTTGLPSPIPTFWVGFTCVGKPPGTGCGIGHGYHESTINPNTGDFYHRASGSGNVFKFSHSTQTWSECAGWSSSQQVANALEYFPDRNSLLYVDGDWGIWELSLASGNCTSGTWVQRASTIGGGFSPQILGISSYHNQSMYSPGCQCILIVGQSSTTMWRYHANGTFSQAATMPQVAGIPQAGNGAIFTRDPVSGKILMWHNSNAASIMYEYDAAANTWATISRSSPMFPGPEGGVTETVAIPVSTYGVIMFVQVGSASGGQVRLYKHAAGAPDTTPPTAPSGLNVSAASSSQLNLSWTTSIDDVGVTGYLVERSAAGCGSFSQIATPTGTSFSDTGRTASTTYCYRVRATDGTNLSAYSPNASGTTLAADTTPPSIPTNLIATPVSNSQINLTWNVSTDNFAVTGYLLERCSGVSCSGFAQIAAPGTNSYSDTVLLASTSYSYRVRATDGANLSGFSSTASATTQAASGGDFATRCAAPGVVRCFGFDTNADLGGTYGNNFGNFNNAGTCNGTTIRCPVIDTGTKASGTGAMRFTQPSQSGAGAAGQWFTNFSPDLATQFGAGGEFWIQWRQRFDDAFVTNVYTGGDNEGPKQIDISGGDTPGCTIADNTNCRSSNVDIELVMQNLQQRGYSQMYGYLDFGSGPSQFLQLAENFGSDFKFQNARSAPYCLYSQNFTVPKTSFPPSGNCIGYFANEWMTFKVHVRLGPLVSDSWNGSAIDLWIGREGQASQQAIAWTGDYGASSNRFGKVWLLPYITNKNGAQVHTPSNTWYDELIISTQNIADPGGTPAIALVAPTNVQVTP